MSNKQKSLATIAFVTIIYLLKWWLGFEAMIMIVMCAWFTTILDK